MKIAEIQAALNARGWAPPLATDGRIGPKTMAAVDAALASSDKDGWPIGRKLIAAEQVVYRDAGLYDGPIDGLIGPLTADAREDYAGGTARSNFRDNEPAPASQPRAAPVWPRDDNRGQAELHRFFGAPGTGHTRLVIPDGYPMLIYDGPQRASTITVHEKIHDPVKRVLERVLDHYGPEEICRLGFNRFFGCYNPRNKRGGSTLSIHAFAAALDFHANANQLRWNHTRASFAHPDCETWWELWEAEGFVSLGRARDYDWMHLQAARL